MVPGTKEARVRIESHRLMRSDASSMHVARVEGTHAILKERATLARKTLRSRAYLHVGLFITSFIFTTGAAVLGILLWVRPDGLLALVLVGLGASAVFVTTFAYLRQIALRHVVRGSGSDEDEPEPHLGKSIAYGFVGLALALLIAGLIFNIASANPLAVG